MRGQATSSDVAGGTRNNVPGVWGRFLLIESGAPESELAYFHWRVTILGRGGDLKLIIP